MNWQKIWVLFELECSVISCVVVKHKQANRADLCNSHKSKIHWNLLQVVQFIAVIIVFMPVDVRFKNNFENYKAKHHSH